MRCFDAVAAATNANMTNANMTNANMTNANMTNANMTNANMEGAAFDACLGPVLSRRPPRRCHRHAGDDRP
jgi:hypothetical protein